MRRLPGPEITFVLAGFLKIVTIGGLAQSAPVDAIRTAAGASRVVCWFGAVGSWGRRARERQRACGALMWWTPSALVHGGKEGAPRVRVHWLAAAWGNGTGERACGALLRWWTPCARLYGGKEGASRVRVHWLAAAWGNGERQRTLADAVCTVVRRQGVRCMCGKGGAACVVVGRGSRHAARGVEQPGGAAALVSGRCLCSAWAHHGAFWLVAVLLASMGGPLLKSVLRCACVRVLRAVACVCVRAGKVSPYLMLPVGLRERMHAWGLGLGAGPCLAWWLFSACRDLLRSCACVRVCVYAGIAVMCWAAKVIVDNELQER